MIQQFSGSLTAPRNSGLTLEKRSSAGARPRSLIWKCCEPKDTTETTVDPRQNLALIESTFPKFNSFLNWSGCQQYSKVLLVHMTEAKNCNFDRRLRRVIFLSFV